MRLPSESSASSVVPELVELPPYLGGVYRGNVYSDLKQYDKAIADYSDYIRPRPNDPDGYNNRAHCYEELGDTRAAQRDRARAEKLSE